MPLPASCYRTTLSQQTSTLRQQAGASAIERPTFVRNVFSLQSYFDTTLSEKALLEQPASDPIVSSTAREEQIAGRLFCLHPASQAPIAIETICKGTKTEALIVKPGQIVRPFGTEQFDSFRWGLPFGWLGGGTAYLGVLLARDADVNWPGGDPELVFHRLRISPGAGTGQPNWPLRLPWPNARRGATSAFQSGQPVLALNGTRVLVRCNTAGLVAAGTLRIAVTLSDAFGDATVCWVDDIAIPLGVANPIVEVGTPLAGIGGDSAILTCTDVDGALAGTTFDFVRFGRL